LALIFDVPQILEKLSYLFLSICLGSGKKIYESKRSL